MSKRRTLEPEHCEHIKERINEISESAQSISEKMEKSPSWLGKILQGTIKSVGEKDLISLLAILYKMTKEEVLNKNYLEKFINLDFHSSSISWTENEKFNDYINCDEKSIENDICLLLDRINSVILTQANHREKYAFLKSLETLYRNIDYSLDQTILLNSLELHNISNFDDPDLQNNYSHKLIIEYDKLHKFGIKYGEIEIYNRIHKSAEEIYPIIEEIISNIEKATMLLRELSLDNKQNQIDYNLLAKGISDRIEMYSFSNYVPSMIRAEIIVNKSLDNQIKTNIDTLAKLKKDMFYHKNNAEKGIDYIDYTIETFI